MIRKELKFKHEGIEYVVVTQFTKRKLEDTANNPTMGVPLWSAQLYNLTEFRKKNP